MRIYITGPGGSGKSTLATKLSEKYGIPVVHLDTLMWLEGWIENPDYGKLQREAVEKPEWIIEGASVSIMKSMKEKVDLVVLFNPNPIFNGLRLIKRFVMVALGMEKRIGIAIKDENRMELTFLYKMLRWRKLALPRIRETIVTCGLEGKILELDSQKDAYDRVAQAISLKHPGKAPSGIT